jgi:hypothetical protein
MISLSVLLSMVYFRKDQIWPLEWIDSFAPFPGVKFGSLFSIIKFMGMTKRQSLQES